MLIATVLAIFLVFNMDGGTFGQLMSDYAKKPMKATIEDDDRRKLALHELTALTKDLKDFNKGVVKDTKSLQKLVEDYATSPEDFDQLFESAFSRRKQEMSEVWKQRDAMLQHVEPEEWQAIISSAKAKAK